MKVYLSLVLACAVIVALTPPNCYPQKKPTRPLLPTEGVLPDEATVVKVAEAVFAPVFGNDAVSKYRPYHAVLKHGIWTVYGTLQTNARGGTPMMTVQKSDGRVTEIWFSQ